jgi:DNA-binding FadR family transcriptional regulator
MAQLGERLPTEPELAEALGVGRNTVREAIRVLSYSRMLDVRQGNGTYVNSVVDPAEALRRVNRSSLRDHLELQSVLESEAARFAAQRRTDQDIIALYKALDARDEQADDVDIEGFFERDRTFHLAVAAAAHNTAIEELYRYFALSIPLHSQLRREDGRVDVGYPEHRAIVEAIVEKDEDAAAVCARRILGSRIERLSEAAP